MVDLKISIHPLFYIFGLYFAFTGKVFSFIIYTLVAVLHELGHYFASLKLGYKLNKITLLPYGAIITGDDLNLSYIDECKISIAGPLINLYTSLLFVALWWFFPSLYPYTDLIVFASTSLAIINLLPCYPLDGGRFLLATLSLYFKRKTAKKIVKALGLTLSILIFILFIISIFNSLNITILFFAVFMFLGVINKNEDNSYVKVYSSFTNTNLKSKEVKRYIINGDLMVKELYTYNFK